MPGDLNLDYYDILDVDRDATEDQIKKAYVSVFILSYTAVCIRIDFLPFYRRNNSLRLLR